MKRLKPLRLPPPPGRLPASRLREADAIAAYDRLAALAVRRLPPGYRLSRQS